MERVSGVSREIVLQDLTDPNKAPMVPLHLIQLSLHGPFRPGDKNLHDFTEERFVNGRPASVESGSGVVPWSRVGEQHVLYLLHGESPKVRQCIRHRDHLQGIRISDQTITSDRHFSVSIPSDKVIK